MAQFIAAMFGMGKKKKDGAPPSPILAPPPAPAATSFTQSTATASANTAGTKARRKAMAPASPALPKSTAAVPGSSNEPRTLLGY